MCVHDCPAHLVIRRGRVTILQELAGHLLAAPGADVDLIAGAAVHTHASALSEGRDEVDRDEALATSG